MLEERQLSKSEIKTVAEILLAPSGESLANLPDPAGNIYPLINIPVNITHVSFIPLISTPFLPQPYLTLILPRF